MSILSNIQKAMEKARNQPYQPSYSPLICKHCGRLYGQSIYGTYMGDCGRHNKEQSYPTE